MNEVNLFDTLPFLSFWQPWSFTFAVPVRVLSVYDELLFNIVSKPILFIRQGSWGGWFFQGVRVHLNSEDEMNASRGLVPFTSGGLDYTGSKWGDGFHWDKPLKPGYVPSYSDSEGDFALFVYLWASTNKNLINKRWQWTWTKPVVTVWLSYWFDSINIIMKNNPYQNNVSLCSFPSLRLLLRGQHSKNGQYKKRYLAVCEFTTHPQSSVQGRGA